MLAGCAPSSGARGPHAPEAEPLPDPARPLALAAAIPAIEKEVAERLAKEHIPGLALGVVLDGRLLYAKGFGVKDLTTGAPVDETTVFRIGSITKTFTTTTILSLRDRGKLSLDELIERYLPEASGLVYPTTDSAKITLRHLLTHASGLPRLGNFSYTNTRSPLEESTILRSLKGFRLAAAPDVDGLYSNFGVTLAGIVAAHAARESYRDLVQAAVLGPLGMTSTRWDRTAVPPDRLATAYSHEGADIVPRDHWMMGAAEPCGGLYSNLVDMARYAAFQLAAWPPRDTPDDGPVRRSSLREAHRMTRFADVITEGPGRARASGVGLTWLTYQDCDFEAVVWHNGGTEGYGAALYMLPERGLAVIVLQNLSGADSDGFAKIALSKVGKALARTARAKREGRPPSEDDNKRCR